MFDRPIRRIIDPPLNHMGRWLAQAGATANAVTALGLVLGLCGAGLIAQDHLGAALALILLSRLADGLDGAVARATQPTTIGGYLDITADFAFYGAVPLAFALRAPEMALPAAVLLFSFYVNGASFLGYAILAEKHGLETRAQGIKSLYYSNGLLEGSETIAFFALLCLFPQHFTPLALGFAALCVVTAVFRIHGAIALFTKD